MSATEVELERIVREVLRRLRELEIAKVVSAESVATPTLPNTLTLVERLVTLGTLKGKLDGVARVVVPAKAVVTPAVRDELKTRKISLEYAAKSSGQKNETKRLLLAVATQYNPAALAQRMSATGTKIELVKVTDWKDAVGKMTLELKRTQTCGVILTDRPAAVACHANRDGAIRAAVASDLRGMKEAAQSLDANLLVVDPAMHSLHMLEKLLEEYAKSSQHISL